MTPVAMADLAPTSASSYGSDVAPLSTKAAPCVLFIVDQLTELGGGERVLLELARKLPALGYRSLVITFREGPAPAAYDLCENITILPLTSCFNLKALSVARQMREIILREHVDIVHTFFESADTFGALVARAAGIKALISSRRDMGILRTTKHKIAYRLLAPLYSSVITVSDTVYAWHQREDRISKRKMKTIPNGLSLDRLTPKRSTKEVREQLHVDPSAMLITTIANINPWKGVDVLVAAADIVLRQYPKATFAIAGDWTDTAHLQTLRSAASDLGIADRLLFLGRVDDVAGLLLASDVSVLLSRSEGMPNVVLEAMAAGLPVVATAVGGTREVVVDGVTGFLVPNEDSVCAAQRICQLISDPALRARMGAAGAARIREHFAADKMILAHVDLYDSLVATR